ATIRKALVAGADGPDAAIERLLGSVDDAELPGLVGDLGGHDLAMLLDAFAEAEATRGRPTVILAHTIKGWGLPMAGDPLNHTALLSPAQIETLRDSLGIAAGDEWSAFAPDSPEGRLITALPPLFMPPPAPVTLAVPSTLDETY